MDLSSLGPLAASLARAGLPTLGAILSDAAPFPFSMLVKPAFAAITAALGVPQDAPDAAQQVQQQVDADPAAAATKLQTVEQAHKDAADATNEELQARLADVQDARKTTVALVSSGSHIAWGAPVVSGIVVLGFVGILTIMVLRAVPPENAGVFNVLIGTLAISFGAVVNYWLGSSAGSQAKSETIATLAHAPVVNAAAGSHVSSGVITSGGKR